MTNLPLPEQMRRDITALRIVERRSLREIGATYGHSAHWAKRRCLALGLPTTPNPAVARTPPPQPRLPVDEILALRARGLSMTAIARALGITKNAVVGRLWRAGECRPREEIKASQTPNPFAGDGCRWPIGHPREEGFHCCGVRRIPEKPYCAEHCERAYERPKALPQREPIL